VIGLFVFVWAAFPASAVAATTFDAVAPIFTGRCVICHSGAAAPLGLRLDTRDNILKGSQRGSVVKAADPAGSELVRRIRGQSLPRMPLTGPPYLSDNEIALIEKWVADGLTAGQRVASAPAPAPIRPKPGEIVSYRHVAPILIQRCAKCHSQNGIRGTPPEGFRLDSWAETIARGERLRVVPGNPAASELVRRIRGQALPRMPFDGPPYLAEEDIRMIEQWIRQGARDADGNVAPSPVGATVRLHGTLTNTWELDGLPLGTDAATRIDKGPRPGDYVEVRGTVQAGGAVRASRIRRR
jgi:mono/diheme cytochrome c family protein